MCVHEIGAIYGSKMELYAVDSLVNIYGRATYQQIQKYRASSTTRLARFVGK